MTAATSRLRRRGIGAGVSALVGLTSVVGLAAAAHAAPGFTFPDANRVAGADRYATAIDASTTAFPSGTQAGGVVLVSGTSTVDGLTASYVAGSHNAPILLVKNGVIDSATLAEIARLNVTNVWIVGGTSVVPEGVATQLTGKTIVRYNGADRYETAAKAATNNGTVTAQPGKVFIASGTADALAAAPVLYNKKYPLLLTRPGSVPATTADALTQLTSTTHVVLGGTTAVDAGTYASLGGTLRVSGANRYETATAIADEAVTLEGFSRANVALANGSDAAAVDSLTGSVVAGKNGVPLIFGNGTDASPAATTAYLTTNNTALTGQLYVFGGPSVVSAAAATSVLTTVTSPASAASYTFSPTGAAVKPVSVAGNNAGVTQYTVSGLGSTPVNIALVAPSAINTNGTSPVFTVASGASTATLTPATAGVITVVNGVGNASATTAYNITPVNGAVTFTVDSTTPGQAIPIVYSNADSNTTLSASAAGVPSETFGIGGLITWSATAATTANYNATNSNALTVTTVNTTNSTFEATIGTGVGAPTATFSYAVAGSSYNYGTKGPVLSTNQFSAVLSAGDTLSANYNASGPSTFAISQDIPTAPSGVTAVFDQTLNAGGGGVKLTWTASPSQDVDSYTVTRYAVTNGVVASSGTSATVTTPTLSGVTFTATDAAAAGTYVYSVTANSSTAAATALGLTAANTVSPESAKSGNVVVPTSPTPGAVAGAPFLLDSRILDAGTAFSIDAADTIQLIFNEPIAGLPTGAAFRVSDGVNSATITIGAGNVSALPAGTYNGQTVRAGQAYRVTVGTLGGISPAGSTVAIGANLVNVTSNVVDIDQGLTADLTKGDVKLDNGAFSPLVSTDAPVITAGTLSAGKSETFTSSLPLDLNSIAADGSDFTITGGTFVSQVVSADGKTITVTGTSGTTGIAIKSAAVRSIDKVTNA